MVIGLNLRSTSLAVRTMLTLADARIGYVRKWSALTK
jgi:hypothetical protein